MKDLHVVITMDVEVPTSQSHANASGPPDHASGAAWVQSYAGVAADHGLPVTYFVHPEVAVAQADLFGGLAAAGHCLGLHLHAWRFDSRYRCEFGGLDAAETREMLETAGAMWIEALGEAPRYFRPGTMSANDATFRLLAEAGFRGGSLSLPGRVFPDKHAIWMGAPLDPHRAHSHFRAIEGALDFANLPVSVDTSALIEKAGRRFHYDLRPDFLDIDHAAMVARIVEQIAARDPDVACINILTHNDHDFADRDSQVTRNFMTTLKAIDDICAARGVERRGSTLADIADLVLARPPRAAEFSPAGGRVLFDEDDRPGR